MSVKKKLFTLKEWRDVVDALLHLLFPRKCLVCDGELPNEVDSLCSICFINLQFTEFEKYNEPTDLDKLFWGRLQIHSTYSLLFFRKKKGVQKVLHALKYHQKPEVGIEFGKMIGEKIKDIDTFWSVDLIVPVPLHPKKEFSRGYNQSMQLALGVSAVLDIAVEKDFFKKKLHTGSQTKRGKFSRWDNVVSNFISKKEVNEAQHILIVDDVITTGATIESLVRTIRENNPELRVSIASLAVTK